MEKHSKGPWVYHLIDDYADVENNVIDITTEDNESLIAVIPYSGNIIKEYEANARLISAAPDLLLACRLLDSWAISNRSVNLSNTIRNAIQKAREAINKADGKL